MNTPLNKIFEYGYILLINKRDRSDIVTNDLHSKEMMEEKYSVNIDEMEVNEDDTLELHVSVYSERFH